MIHLALLLFLAQAGARAETGVVSGTLKSPSGTPASGVRVTATAVPKPGEPTKGLALLSLAETDHDGNYRLEDIPPGRYYITAGRLELPTYYPGTIEVRNGTVVAVEPGSTISKIDFVLRDESSGRGLAGLTLVSSPGIQIPVQISIDGGGRVPVLIGNYFPILRLKQTSGSVIEQRLSAPSLQLPIPSAVNNGEYRVEVDDLPPEYSVTSLKYVGSGAAVDLTKDPLRVSAQDASQSAPVANAALAALGLSTSMVSFKTLVVILSKGATTPGANGVTITGVGLPSEVPIFLSGVPGIVYADGSFEFSGVQPGRHTLVRFMSSMQPPHAISVVVGDKDLNNVRLQSSNILPQDIESDSPRPAGAHAPGTVLPFASIRGKVVKEGSEEVVTTGGVVIVTGYRNVKRSYAIDGEGRFEIRDLVPGSYPLELAVTGYEAPPQNVVVDDGDAEITFRGRPTVTP